MQKLKSIEFQFFVTKKNEIFRLIVFSFFKIDKIQMKDFAKKKNSFYLQKKSLQIKNIILRLILS